MRNRNVSAVVGICVTLFGIFVPTHDAYTAQVIALDQPNTESCASPEECFLAAVWPRERLGNALTKDQVVALKLERLRKVMEGGAASLWAKRAGLLSGVILADRNPAAALPYLRAAQQDFPVLDDYIRFWIGEVHLRLGEVKEAAAMFEGVSQAVPDS
ncbi:MAG: tetratricopeptide repeat protein, partial [Nitrospira sp.]|nr:tetratricopeptide repeat protein [Nitrospira sp.]